MRFNFLCVALISDVNITGTFDSSTAGTVIGKDTSMSYHIHVEQKKNWNYLAGVNWTINRHWGVLGEIGFGESRQDLSSPRSTVSSGPSESLAPTL